MVFVGGLVARTTPTVRACSLPPLDQNTKCSAGSRASSSFVVFFNICRDRLLTLLSPLGLWQLRVNDGGSKCFPSALA